MNRATNNVHPEKLPGLIGPGIVAAFSFLLYWATLAPSFLWSDSAKLALYVHEREFFTFGFGTHVLHGYLGYLFSFLPGSLAYSQNLMSAVFAALTGGILFWTIRAYTRDGVAAGLGAGAIAVSHLFWLYAVINEAYSMLVFFTAVVLAFAVRMRIRPAKWLPVALAFAFGLGFSNHGLILFVIPGAAIAFLDRDSRERMGLGTLGLCLPAFVLGTAPLFLAPMMKGESLHAVFGSLTSSAHGHSLIFWGRYAGKIVKEILLYPAYLAYQFPTLGIPLGLVGIVSLWRRNRQFTWALLVMWLLPLLFASSYFKQRQFSMLIPSFLFFSFAIGCGAAAVRERFARARSRFSIVLLFALLAAAPPLIYFGAYRTAKAAGIELSYVRSLPYRDTLRYYLLPPKQMERGAEQYARDAFRQAEHDSVILSDFNPGMALLYAQKVLGLRPDLKVAILLDDWYHHMPDLKAEILTWLDEQVRAKGRTVYLADNWEAYYRFSDVKSCYTVTREGGPLWKVTIRGP